MAVKVSMWVSMWVSVLVRVKVRVQVSMRLRVSAQVGVQVYVKVSVRASVRVSMGLKRRVHGSQRLGIPLRLLVITPELPVHRVQRSLHLESLAQLGFWDDRALRDGSPLWLVTCPNAKHAGYASCMRSSVLGLSVLGPRAQV